MARTPRLGGPGPCRRAPRALPDGICSQRRLPSAEQRARRTTCPSVPRGCQRGGRGLGGARWRPRGSGVEGSLRCSTRGAVPPRHGSSAASLGVRGAPGRSCQSGMRVPWAAPPPGFGLPQRGVRPPRGLGGAAALRSGGGAVPGPGAAGIWLGERARSAAGLPGEACGPMGAGPGCRRCGAGVGARAASHTASIPGGRSRGCPLPALPPELLFSSLPRPAGRVSVQASAPRMNAGGTRTRPSIEDSGCLKGSPDFAVSPLCQVCARLFFSLFFLTLGWGRSALSGCFSFCCVQLWLSLSWDVSGCSC